MKLRVARHTNDLEKIKVFYLSILEFELLGSFKNHDFYDGIFIGNSNLDSHFEFTQSTDNAKHQFDEDDIIVLYPETISHYNSILNKVLESNISIITSKNPYWNTNGKMFLDPDGYRIIISPLKIK
ncbi:VOC family protein [Flavobacterium sp. CHNK8]|uniref:VOC family protein n=1 Tax=Flavobacterium sp. CHNK8 TaxID=2871165 RepID=UPI001C8D53DE|nr:VOC family protein [Flavobacterium sp. CHNK8]QZK90365.1 VOC family protein [Flavobacterium sp. CHNK8]